MHLFQGVLFMYVDQRQNAQGMLFLGLKTEGLFRRSATTQVVQEVQQRFNLGKSEAD